MSLGGPEPGTPTVLKVSAGFLLLAGVVNEPLGLKIGESIAMLVVFALWTRWWYAQRVHFLEEDATWPSKGV